MKKLLLGLGTAWAFALLFFLWQWSQNGRYQCKAADANIIIDSRTGATYRADHAAAKTTLLTEGI